VIFLPSLAIRILLPCTALGCPGPVQCPALASRSAPVTESRHRLQGGILYVNVKRATNLPRKPLYLGGSVPIVGSPHSKVKVRPSLGIVLASERGLKRYSCCVTLSTLPAPHRHT